MTEHEGAVTQQESQYHFQKRVDLGGRGGWQRGEIDWTISVEVFDFD